MQLYNTLSAEERAIMIDDSENKDLLCLSMLMRIKTTNFVTIYS
jgi:hypothetical protein